MKQTSLVTKYLCDVIARREILDRKCTRQLCNFTSRTRTVNMPGRHDNNKCNVAWTEKIEWWLTKGKVVLWQYNQTLGIVALRLKLLSLRMKERVLILLNTTTIVSYTISVPQATGPKPQSSPSLKTFNYETPGSPWARHLNWWSSLQGKNLSFIFQRLTLKTKSIVCYLSARFSRIHHGINSAIELVFLLFF